jgi:hypothetical protein
MLNWLKRLTSWLAEAWILWLTVAVPFICVLIVFRQNLSEPFIRLAGLFLQLIGIFTVLHGIADTRRIFNQAPLLEIALLWLKAFPRIHLQKIHAHVIAQTGGLNMSGRVTLKHLPGTNATLEDRVRVLESNLDGIDRRTIELQQLIDQEKHNRNESLASERQRREHEIDDVRTKLEATETGGLNISLMGLVWLCVGLILSTASLELSRLF